MEDLNEDKVTSSSQDNAVKEIRPRDSVEDNDKSFLARHNLKNVSVTISQ